MSSLQPEQAALPVEMLSFAVMPPDIAAGFSEIKNVSSINPVIVIHYMYLILH